jgi:hypothetical protein
MGTGLSDIASAHLIYSKARDFLHGRLTVDEFEDWFLANNWNAHRRESASTVGLVHRIEGLLLDLSADAIDEAVMRRQLERALCPHARAQKYPVVERASSESEAFALPRTLSRPFELSTPVL